MTATTTRPWAAAAIASAITLAGFVPATVHAGVTPTPQHDFIARQRAQNTPEARAVGLITAGFGDDNLVIRGSGVLVGGRFMLTAAHLLDDSGGAVFTVNGQTYGMRRWVVASRFYRLDREGDDPSLQPIERRFGAGADLALVELDRRVVGARNLKATLSRSRKEVGRIATIVGFGRGGDGPTGIGPTNTLGIKTTPTPITTDGTMSAGDTTIGSGVWGFQPIKRAGKNIIEPGDPFSSDPTAARRELVVDFDPDPSRLQELADPNGANLQPPNLDFFTGEFRVDEDDIPVTGEFMPSVGDSGGGLFLNGRLAGITSWTTRANSEFFSQGNFTRLSTGWTNWVRDNIAAYNRLRRDPSLTPWIKVSKGGAGFRGVLRIRDQDNLLTDDDNPNSEHPLRILKIFGPGLFENPDLDVTTNFPFFVANDLAADPAPLSDRTGLVFPTDLADSRFVVPEPAGLALLGLGGLALLRRTRG
jgi:hypothetical protein